MPYQKPRLRRHGRIARITASGSGAMQEMGGMVGMGGMSGPQFS